MYALPQNNTIQSFETAADITGFLKRQWAGLFHRFLQEQTKFKEVRALEQVQATAATLDRLVDFLTAERKDQSEEIRDILRSNHPLFQELRALLNIRYPVFFRNETEMGAWLRHGLGFRPVPQDQWDEPTHAEWWKGDQYLRIARELFDQKGALKPHSSTTLEAEAVELLGLPDRYREAWSRQPEDPDPDPGDEDGRKRPRSRSASRAVSRPTRSS